MDKLICSRAFDSEITPDAGVSQITVLTLPTTAQLYPKLEEDYHVATFTLLETLMLVYTLFSFGEVPTPNILPTDSESEKQAKIAKVQADYPKLGLAVFVDTGSGFKERSMVILQNYKRETYVPVVYPHLTMNSVLLMGPADRIAFQVVNLGKGLLGLGDKIKVHGSFRQERTCMSRVTAVANLKYVGTYQQS